MTKFPFNNNSTPRERRAELLKSGAGATYHGFATGEVNPGRSRYSELEKSSTITGTPAQKYPAVSSHQMDPVGPEPLIDATDCGATFGTALGEPHEQRLGGASDGAGQPSNVSPDEAQAPLGGHLPADTLRRPRRLSRRKD